MRMKLTLAAVAAFIVLVSAGLLWWWHDPLVLPGVHRVEVYALDEDLSGSPTRTPGRVSRFLGMCDSDSYYVEQDGKPSCLVLIADTSSDGPKAFGQVNVTDEDRYLVLKARDVEILRDIANRLPELTDAQSRTLVLVARRKPVAVVPVDALTRPEGMRVRTFG